jgi:ATP-binding cassette, subfamily C (CFTR/MRP), member 1
LLGECQQLEGKISIAPQTKISYVPQQSWIQNATLKENILFGNSYDASRYAQVLYACSLESDIKLLDLGDETEIGEKGVNLSGGQQQRVSLGRASYSNSDLIILDDPLSAVDAHVGQHIFDHLICGFLSNRTRILVTHQVAIATPKADIIICLDSSGNIIANCPPSQLKTAVMSNQSFISRQSSEESEVSEPEFPIKFSRTLRSSNSFTFLDSIINAVKIDSPTAIAATPFSNDEFDDITYEEEVSPASMNHSIRLTPSASSNTTVSSSPSADDRKGKIVDVELKRAGDVPFSVYWFYFKACGGILATSLLSGFTIALMVVWTLQNWGLGLWLTGLQSDNPNDGIRTLFIYLSCVTSMIICTFIRYYLEAAYSCTGAQVLHDQVTCSVLQAPCSWYDATPIGRITNRFSQDISTIDKEIMGNLVTLLDCICGMIQVSTIVLLTMPILLLPIIPIMVFTSWIANRFFRVAREIKRLESVSKSPVFVLFSETLQGLSVVRAFRQESRFFEVCCQRVDDMNRCFLYLWLSNRWLNVRMQILGALVCGLVAYGVIYNVHHLTSTTAGLLLLYSLEFTGYLVWLARSYADAQMNLNSVERIQEYSAVPPEKYHPDLNQDPSSAPIIMTTVKPQDSGVLEQWPMRGDIEFKRLYLKYASANEYVLRDVSFHAPAGKKIGIVGRTGAGKSSLLASLFRTVEPSAGELLIDGVNVLNIPLFTLRSRLAIVPQEPILFTGSIRSNLDPFDMVSDETIWGALNQVKLADHVAAMPGATLSEKLVAEKGSNFSVGQKQLLCMARALLRQTKILVLDECTANVDHETDALIQDTVRNELQNITVLCIAHRLHTIAYYDVIVVMDKGSVAEYGSPITLMSDSSSIFHSMCQSTGDYYRILSIATSSSNKTAEV